MSAAEILIRPGMDAEVDSIMADIAAKQQMQDARAMFDALGGAMLSHEAEWLERIAELRSRKGAA